MSKIRPTEFPSNKDLKTPGPADITTKDKHTNGYIFKNVTIEKTFFHMLFKPKHHLYN